MVPPLFVVKWYMPGEEYVPVEEVLKQEAAGMTLLCQGKKIPVRQTMLYELMGYFWDKREGTDVCSTTTHEIDMVEHDILILVLKFIGIGEVELGQNEYVRFAKAVHVLRPRPTYRLLNKSWGGCVVMSLTESPYTRRLRNLDPLNGEILVKCEDEEEYSFIHSIVASLYCGELKKRIQAAKTAKVPVIINDIKDSYYYAIRDLIYGQQIKMKRIDLLAFCKLLQNYDVTYLGVTSDAPNLPDLTHKQLQEINYGEAKKEDPVFLDEILNIPLEGRRTIAHISPILSVKEQAITPGQESSRPVSPLSLLPTLTIFSTELALAHQETEQSPGKERMMSAPPAITSSLFPPTSHIFLGPSELETPDIEPSPGTSRPSVENLAEALDLPPSDIEPSPGPSRLSVEKLEDVPKSHTEQARIPESQLESGDSTSGTSPASTHSETEIASRSYSSESSSTEKN